MPNDHINQNFETIFKNCKNLFVVPFYKNVDLVTEQINNLLTLKPELLTLEFGIVFINDSPDVTEHKSTMQKGIELLNSSQLVSVYLENSRNLGFVKSANVGLNIARELNKNALLVNSDAFISEGSLTQMAQLFELDDKIGFIGPRSNEASIASILWDLDCSDLDESRVAELAKIACARLPKYQIVPVVPGSVTWIKTQVLNDVGVFDEKYSPGYNEENDLTMRANEIGYISVLANHAFAYHRKSVSFGNKSANLESNNSKQLEISYPYYYKSIYDYNNSIDRTYEKLLVHLALNFNKPTLLIDLSFLKADKTGTSELTVRLLKTIWESSKWSDKFCVTVTVTPEVERYHDLQFLRDKFEVINSKKLTKRKFCVRIYFSQPFSLAETVESFKLAAVNVFYFLDNIATDCLYLSMEEPRLKQLWDFVAKNANSIVFLSNYAKVSFYFRYKRAYREFDFVALPSCVPTEYHNNSGTDYSQETGETETVQKKAGQNSNKLKIFIVGNQFAHKRVKLTTQLVAKNYPDFQIFSLGIVPKDVSEIIISIAGGKHTENNRVYEDNVTALVSGSLTDEKLNSYYQQADLIVFPSNYEGFGFPILKALSFKKDIVAFDLPVFREIISKINSDPESQPYLSYLHLVNSFDELIEFIGRFKEGKPSVDLLEKLDKSMFQRDGTWNWENCANIFFEAIVKSLDDKEVGSKLQDLLKQIEFTTDYCTVPSNQNVKVIAYRILRAIYKKLPTQIQYKIRAYVGPILKAKRI